MLNHRGCAAEANKKYHNSELGDDKGLLQRKKDAMEMEKCNVDTESKKCRFRFSVSIMPLHFQNELPQF